MLFLVSRCTARISDGQVRAVRRVHQLFELFIRSELEDTGSMGDAEEYDRESKTVLLLSLIHI